MENTEATVSSHEAAQQLGVSVTTVTRLIKQGFLTAYKLTNGKTSPLRIYQSSIDRYLAARPKPKNESADL